MSTDPTPFCSKRCNRSRKVGPDRRDCCAGDHVACWTAAGLLEAEKKFRKVKGYRELKELNRILNPALHSQAQVA